MIAMTGLGIEIVPCHRVIGSDGHLTGYAGGIGRKQWLLAHESGETAF
ncbi:methylated-DNA--[protein]-cysteine S-methyltransferase [Chromohalobacter japonicus]